jgi:flavin reductase (DIM6/NTAB) family NADH-FMN oxidoreductase RutF
MTLHAINIRDLRMNIFERFDKSWFVLTSGDYKTSHFNAMTISWGSLGTIWDKPFAQVVVRPSRYTFEFMDKSDSFTLCAFGKKQKSALNLLGTQSGREGDKIKASGLTPIPSTQVASPGFKEANLIIECRKIYWQDLDPSHFLLPEIEHKYPKQDYHRAYFGEVLAVFGSIVYTR